MEKRETIIIGGGASGLMCGVIANLNGYKVTILEADVKVGKKILVSGNGRCNFSNANILPNSYNQNMDKYLNKFDSNKAVEIFKFLGVEPFKDNEGRWYPNSNLSSSILDVMLNRLNLFNTEILTQTVVTNVLKQNNNYVVKTNKGDFECEKVVLACGSNKLINIMDNLKLSYKKFVPSLCALKVNEKVNELSGIRLPNVKVTLLTQNKTYSEFGEVLFKDNGLSGICIMNLSSYLARANNFNARVSINLLPSYNEKELIEYLIIRKNNLLNVTAEKFFLGLFHKNVGYEILKRAKINLKQKVADFNDVTLQDLAKIILNFNFNVVGAYDNNQVFSGGVELTELTDNLESKLNKNFYVCGETCNVDGLCGGYNLQWAWTSGFIVGESISKKWLK